MTKETYTRRPWILVGFLLGLALVFSNSQVAEAQELSYRVYLVGDTGGAESSGSLKSLKLLKAYLNEEGENSAVVFLGDNVYCCGLPDSSAKGRAQAEMRLEEALASVDDFSGRSFFIPGNHDWGGAGNYSVETLGRQQKYVESRLGEGSFLPADGFPGPIEVKLTQDIRLVILDTQWWLMDDKPLGDTGEYELSEEGDFLVELSDLLAKRDDEQLLVLGHHPLMSYGTHGGYFPIKEHIFPLTAVWENAWLPMPVLGSLVAVARRFAGGRQDLSNPKYRTLQDALITMFAFHPGNLIYASGHDHSLQHILNAGKNYLVSGSASRPSFVSVTDNAEFTSSESGFMVLDYRVDGSVTLRVVSDEDVELHAVELYKATAQKKGAEKEPIDRVALRSEWGEYVTKAVNPSRKAGFVKSKLLGGHHRAAWTTPITVPVFDVTTKQGGLTPVRRGGGLQTTSLRLLDYAGNQYVLRSMDKDPSKSIPVELQETIANDVVTDQTAIILPFSALLVPPLSEAAGVYYAKPEMVYVPNDPAFGVYQELVANTMMLFERRPDGDMSAFANFGNSKNVISTPKTFRELADDNDNRVDQHFFARSRLFDMFLSDWDRHQDQWRWATFDDPDGKGDLLRPIPRDRDWSFNRMNGFFPSIIKSDWVLPKFQDFRPKFGMLRGLNASGMPLDRRFTASLTEADWRAIGEEMEKDVTDVSIQASVDALPAEVKSMYYEEFASTLKSRRGQLAGVGAEYYTILAALVDVVGSDKHEQFVVESFGDSLLVVMNKTKKDGEYLQELFRRMFYKSETEEVRLYGLGGQDRFELSGPAGFDIRVYAIGGPGEDRYVDGSTGSGSKRWYVRDTPGSGSFSSGRSTRDQITNDPSVLQYNSNNYWFEALLPKIILSSNEQDGFVFGGGATHTSYVFHRTPFSTRHDIALSYAAGVQSLTIAYDGWFNQRLGNWGIETHLLGEMEGTVRGFYGFGTKSQAPVSRNSFYRSEFEGLTWDLGISRDLGNGLIWNIGSFIESSRVEDSDGSYATLPEAGLDKSAFDRQVHTGLTAQLMADGRDNTVYPESGFLFHSTVRSRLGLAEGNGNYTSFSSRLQMFFTPRSNGETTFTTSLGWEHVTGDFQFFHSAVLGEKSGLRGWRQSRFSGNTTLYQNVEIRHELFEFANMLTAGKAGVLAFLDNGRVWYDGEKSNVWHQGYGGGIWFNLFDMAIFQVSVAHSEENTLTSFGFGFDI